MIKFHPNGSTNKLHKSLKLLLRILFSWHVTPQQGNVINTELESFFTSVYKSIVHYLLVNFGIWICPESSSSATSHQNFFPPYTTQHRYGTRHVEQKTFILVECAPLSNTVYMLYWSVNLVSMKGTCIVPSPVTLYQILTTTTTTM